MQQCLRAMEGHGREGGGWKEGWSTAMTGPQWDLFSGYREQKSAPLLDTHLYTQRMHCNIFVLMCVSGNGGISSQILYFCISTNTTTQKYSLSFIKILISIIS